MLCSTQLLQSCTSSEPGTSNELALALDCSVAAASGTCTYPNTNKATTLARFICSTCFSAQKLQQAEYSTPSANPNEKPKGTLIAIKVTIFNKLVPTCLLEAPALLLAAVAKVNWELWLEASWSSLHLCSRCKWQCSSRTQDSMCM